MKKPIAFALCVLYLLVLLLIGWFISSGTYGRLATGEPIDWSNLNPYRPGTGRFFLISGLVLSLFAILDASTIFSRPMYRAGRAPTPFTEPGSYALVRLRRYGLIPLAYGYGIIVVRLLVPTSSWGEEWVEGRVFYVTALALMAYPVLFVVARRPLSWTYGQLWLYLVDGFSAFARGASGGR